MPPKRKRARRPTFVFDEETTEKLGRIYSKHNGNWSKLILDDEFKEIGCFRKEAEMCIQDEVTHFTQLILERCVNGEIEIVKEMLLDWRYAPIIYEEVIMFGDVIGRC